MCPHDADWTPKLTSRQTRQCAEETQFKLATVLNGLAIVDACGRAENRIWIILASFRACSNDPYLAIPYPSCNPIRARPPPSATISTPNALQKVFFVSNTAAPIVLPCWKAFIKGVELAGCKKCLYKKGAAESLHPITEISHGIAALKYSASRLPRPFARRNCFNLFL